MDQKVETLCKVCGDKASGKHYGVPSCDGCRGFFKRSIRSATAPSHVNRGYTFTDKTTDKGLQTGLAYHCKESGSCIVDVTRRNQCQACRFKKCLAVNMKRDAVQHERAPRTTIPPPCSALTGNRRHGYGYSTHGTFLSPSGHFIDMPAYHFIYPQQPFSFHFGVKPHNLGLPSSLGLGIFNSPDMIAASSTYKTSQDILHSHNYFPIFRRSTDSSTAFDETNTPTSANKAKEDEVSSSEEARDIHIFRAYDPLTAKSSFMDLTISQTLENVYESAAKLLFLTVKWARSIPSFLQLSFHDQSALLEDSWSELFILSAAQWTLPINEDYLVSNISPSVSKQEILEKEARKLKETIAKFTLLRVDHTEYACLKALTLFKSEATGLKDRGQVEILQDQTHIMLHDYCTSQDSHKARFGKLLMLLPSVNILSKDLIEELLFRKTVGNISIERVLSDVLRNNYNT